MDKRCVGAGRSVYLAELNLVGFRSKADRLTLKDVGKNRTRSNRRCLCYSAGKKRAQVWKFSAATRICIQRRKVATPHSSGAYSCQFLCEIVHASCGVTSACRCDPSKLADIDSTKSRLENTIVPDREFRNR